MKRWLFSILTILIVLWNFTVLARLGQRNRELENAISLGHRQVETIDRQIDALQKQTETVQEQTEALNQCTVALNRLANQRK